MMIVTVITKTVEANNSLRVDQATLLNSARTSFKKLTGLAIMLIAIPLLLPLHLQERQDLSRFSRFLYFGNGIPPVY